MMVDLEESVVKSFSATWGDLVVLSREKDGGYEISGFFIQRRGDAIQLSYESPRNAKRNNWIFRRRQSPFNPAKWYNLEPFTSYEIRNESSK